MKSSRIATLVLLLVLAALPCLAAVSPEEAAKLKTTLTPLGAERAGNKEGTIPAWTGNHPPVPPGTRNDRFPGELFPDEKPLFSITGKNVDQYADKLTEGVKQWLKRHASYRLDVYPTHRTGGIVPEYIYEATFKNATRAKLSADGNDISGAVAGVPFPIPKSGIEALWNHIVSPRPSASAGASRAWIVPPSGNPILVAEFYSETESPYYYKNLTEDRYLNQYEGNSTLSWLEMTAPARSVGEQILSTVHTNYSLSGENVIYTYLVGQRRVRRAPSYSYDTPVPTNSGYGNSDENNMFYGKPDRYNFKLIGKKELYVPYNCNRLNTAGKDAEIFGTGQHPNPDRVRWELHRVWVVEATLIPGKRHVQPRRVLYIDEDSWQALATDLYDAQGKLWKTGLKYISFDPRGPMSNSVGESFFNLQTDGFLLQLFASQETGRPRKWVYGPALNPKSFYEPDAMATRNLR